MTEKLFSSSPEKARLFGIKGISSVDSNLISRRIGKVEDDFYREEAIRQSMLQGKLVSDGLIFPYMLNYDGLSIPLPVMVTLIKANEARNIIFSDQDLKKSIDNGIVNDAIWAVGDDNGFLTDAINKTDPNRNHGDIQRLGDFFTQQEGRYLYSVGSTATVNSETGNINISLGLLRVGRIRSHSTLEFNEIFGPHLKKSGAFNLDFVLRESLLEKSEGFIVSEQKVKFANAGLEYGEPTIWNSYYLPEAPVELQFAAHGIPRNLI